MPIAASFTAWLTPCRPIRWFCCRLTCEARFSIEGIDRRRPRAFFGMSVDKDGRRDPSESVHQILADVLEAKLPRAAGGEWWWARVEAVWVLPHTCPTRALRERRNCTKGLVKRRFSHAPE